MASADGTMDESEMYRLAQNGIRLLAAERIAGLTELDREIFEKVRDLIVRVYNIPSSRITPDCTFFGDIQLESLDHNELVMTIEEEFDIEVSEEEYQDAENMTDLIRIIRSHLQSKQIPQPSSFYPLSPRAQRFL